MSLTTEQRTKIVNEAATWIGTRYRGWSCIKQIGTDCGMLLKGVLQNSNHLPAGDLDISMDYSLQVSQHKPSEDYVNHILRFCREVPESEVLPGDIVVYKLGFAFAHAGIIVDWSKGRMIHAIAHGGVRCTDGYTHPTLKGHYKKFYTLRDEWCKEIK